ncbi:methyl-accepting chemotaxis protein [Bosea sp. RAF48]|uniref:methyl-accepting chemotaxis protein n=1 Tax=Bosea sp. RAF48 TaxID=3237480 RepID=UPI003F918D90
MFPSFFKATVRQRLTLWASMLGVLACVFGIAETIGSLKLAGFARALAVHTDAVAVLSETDAALSRIVVTIVSGGDRGALPSDIEALKAAMKAVAARSQGEVAARAEEAVQGLEAFSSKLGADATVARGALRKAVEQRNELRVRLNAAVAGVSEALGAHVESSRQNTVLLAGLGLFLVTLIIAFEYRWLVRPISTMAAALSAPGEDAGWVQKLARRGDEIGMLGRALHSHLSDEQTKQEAAKERLASLAGEVERQRALRVRGQAFQGNIAGIATALETHAASMTDASNELSQLSGFVDQHAGAAAQSSQRAANHVEQMSSSLNEIAELLATTAGEAQRTSGIANAAKTLVEEATDDSVLLREAVGSISAVVTLISTVANQTNLLALNATIEAARAGESGRGFAVVAAEVKQLANRTAEATGQVRQGLDSIGTAAERIIGRIGALVASVNDVEAAADSIAELARRQDDTSRTINIGTAQTASDVRGMAEQVEQVAGMIEDWRRMTERMARASADIDGQAAALRQAVDGFMTDTQGVQHA